MRRQIEVEAGTHDRAADRIVAASGAQRGDCAFVVALGETQRVLRQFRMVQLWLGNEGHGTALRNGMILFASTLSPIASAMKRAVIGVPSKCSTRVSFDGSISSSLTSSVRNWPSRFCSTTKTWSCSAMKLFTS